MPGQMRCLWSKSTAGGALGRAPFSHSHLRQLCSQRTYIETAITGEGRHDTMAHRENLLPLHTTLNGVIVILRV